MTQSPSYCGLAITYPLNYASFKKEMMDCHRQRFPYDYSLQFWPGADANEIWNEFKEVAKIIVEVGKIAASFGVEVIFDATYKDVANLFKKKSVVTVFSHNPNDLIKKEDILSEKNLLKIINTIENSYLKNFLTIYYSEYKENHSDESTIINGLNLLISQGGNEQSKLDKLERINKKLNTKTIRPLSRIDIDIIFRNIIVPSDAMDFTDGARNIFDIQAMIPHSFHGLADLGICYSRFIGETLKGKGRNRGDYTCLVNGNIVDIESRVLIYKYVINLLAASDNLYDYSEASYLVRKKILDIL